MMIVEKNDVIKVFVGRAADKIFKQVLCEILAETECFDEEFREYSSQERYYRYRSAADGIQEHVEKTETRTTRKVMKKVLKKHPRFTRILCAIISYTFIRGCCRIFCRAKGFRGIMYYRV